MVVFGNFQIVLGGIIIYNLTKQDFWLFYGVNGLNILASNINTNTDFEVGDEIIVMFTA